MNPRRPLLLSLLACTILLSGAGGPLMRIVVDADAGAAPDDIGAPPLHDGGTPQDADASTGADGGAPAANGWEKKIADLLRHPTLKGVALSIQGVNLRTGKEVYAFAPDLSLNPASVTKVVTAAAALEYLGPHFAWATDVLVEKGTLPSDDGVVTGNLFVRGYGDPQLTSERVFLFVTELMGRGLTRVTGDLVIDDSWFDGEREPRGWEKQRGEGGYYAVTGAVSVNFNSVTVHVRPGAEGKAALVTLEPAIPYVRLVNNAKTSEKGKRSISVKIKPRKGGEEVEVKGSIPVNDEGKTYYRRVSDPPVYAGQLIKETMKMRGLKVGGKVRAGKAPDDADLFWTYFSQKLAVITRDMNKASNNFTAEQALKTVGGLKGAPASFDHGLAAMEEWLEKAGVKRGTYTMTNGSGLSHRNRFTSAQIVKVLQYAWGQFKWQPDFVSSMSIASGDGTVRKRYRGAPASFKLRAKTGSIDGVASLCGYVPNAAGDIIAFSVIASGFAQKKYREVTHLEDDIANALAESR